MAAKLKFRCSYQLDERVDEPLASLNQAAYRALQTSLSDGYRLEAGPEGLPDPVQYYCLYVAVLIYGAADAALTLVLHNLGREARILERQIFEYWVRAAHYAQHPDEARVAFHSTPFQEKALLDEFGYDKTAERYQTVLRLCGEVREKIPEASKYREPTIRTIIDPRNNPELARFYALHYRASSQMAHASFAGVGGVWGLEGLSFDSRQNDPNYTVGSITIYLIAFLDLANQKLSLNIDGQLAEFKKRLRSIQERLTKAPSKRK